MKGGICYLSLAAVRAEPSHTSEMVNQLLYGDMVDITDQFKHWVKIRALHDGYKGWCDLKQLTMLTDETMDVLRGSSINVLSGQTGLLTTPGKPGLQVVMGSTLYTLSNGRIAGPEGSYLLAEGECMVPGIQQAGDITETASYYLNAPYLWGGRSPFGIDCSGLVQMVFKLRGISLLRDASQQAGQGALVHLIEETLAGDVAFFDNEEGNIVHTGILTGKGSIIHSSGRVKIDPIDHHGIFNREEGKYSHKLRLIRRFVS